MSYRLGWILYWTCLALPVAFVALAVLHTGGLSPLLTYLDSDPMAALLLSAGTIALWGIANILRYVVSEE
jgi:hypothetical protein